jgi:hypothetical protein
MYEQATGTLALVEAYGVTGDKKLKQPCQMAVDALRSARVDRPAGLHLSGRPAGCSVELIVLGLVFVAPASGRCCLCTGPRPVPR